MLTFCVLSILDLGCVVNKSFKIIALTIAAATLCVAPASAQAQNQSKSAAQARKNNPINTPATSGTPWYERFTFGSELDSGVNSWNNRSGPRATVKVSPRARWGVTFGANEQPQKPNLTTPTPNASTSAGAYIDVTKNIRVGGEVSVQEINEKNKDNRFNERKSPSVKVESAFRF